MVFHKIRDFLQVFAENLMKILKLSGLFEKYCCYEVFGDPCSQERPTIFNIPMESCKPTLRKKQRKTSNQPRTVSFETSMNDK